MGELINTINPIIRGWGNYYCRSHVRRRFNQLDRWIVQRLVASPQTMAEHRLEGLPNEKAAHGVQAGQPCRANTFSSDRARPFMKAGCGKTARPVCAADGGKLFNRRLLRPDTDEASNKAD